MKKLSLLLFLSGILWLSGCALMPRAYRKTSEYDITVSQVQSAGGRLNVGVIRNLSGADRRFLYRREGDLMQPDEYNRWVLSPELMFERALRMGMIHPGEVEVSAYSRVVKLGAVISRFEFDTINQQAVIEVDFSARCYVDSTERAAASLKVVQRAAIEGNSPEGSAAAMGAAMQKCVEAAAELVNQVQNQ